MGSRFFVEFRRAAAVFFYPQKPTAYAVGYRSSARFAGWVSQLCNCLWERERERERARTHPLTRMVLTADRSSPRLHSTSLLSSAASQSRHYIFPTGDNVRHLANGLITITLVLWLNLSACPAQTLSNCRPPPPMPANVRPGVAGLSLSRDGKTLVVATGDAKIRFVDLATGEVRRTFTGHTNAVYRGVFSPDEKLLASSSRDHTARIWNVASGQELRQLDGFRCAVKAVAFSPDGQMLAASGNDGMLKLWEVKTGKELKSLVHKDSADIDMATYAFVFNRDGKKIYAGNGDGTISEWDTAAGKENKVWRAHDQTTFRLQFSPDYRILASFGDSVVKLWDTSNWRELRRLSMERSPAVSALSSMMVFSHNGGTHCRQQRRHRHKTTNLCLCADSGVEG